MDLRIDQLPDDPKALKAMLAAQALENREAQDKLKAENTGLKTENDLLTKRNELLEDLAARLDHHLRVLKRVQYGRRSEKLDPDQLALGLEDTEQAIGDILHEFEHRGAAPKAGASLNRRNRGALTGHLPREERVLEPDDKTCSTCGGSLHEIGEDVSERLEYQPARFKVIRTRRPKYGCRCCENAPVQAAAEPRLVEGGLPTENLIAHVIVSKYCDHLPLYRQCQIFAREGVDIDRSTLADWVGRSAYELRPVHARLVEIIKSSGPIFCDETHAPVLDPGRGSVKKGQFWALARDARSFGGEDPPAVAYIFRPGRCKDSAAEALKGYSGKVQVDGYASYKSLMNMHREEGPVMLSFCMAHLRRKFYDEIKDGFGPMAEEALRWIGELYKIEDEARGLPPDKRCAIRQEKAKSIMEAFRRWLEEKIELIPARFPLAGAIRYAFNHWDGLLLYLDDGRLEIDNNTVERTIRPLALGRRNHLFAGSETGAEHWAILSSLAATCRLNDVNPQAYFADVLTKIVNGWPQSRIDDLLPFSYAENKT